MTNKLKSIAIPVFAGAMLVYGFVAYNAGANPPNEKPKNIIVIDICSLRRDHISGYGYQRNTTPNLDTFMKDSASFDNFWTEAGWCLPNFATTMTGTRTETHGEVLVDENPSFGYQPPFGKLTTLSEIFNKYGFKTAEFSGSRYFAANSYGLDRGFETKVGTYSPNSPMGKMGGSEPFESYKNNVFNWLSENKTNPFFAYITIDNLHSPYDSGNPSLFDPGYKGIADNINPNLDFDRLYNGESSMMSPQGDAEVKEFKSNPANLRHLIARYDAAVLETDSNFGSLIDEIKKDGLWDKSLIIVMAHQGELLGEHGLLGHTQGIYEQILDVPLFIHWPGVAESGKHYSELTERIDVPATILDSVGLLVGNSKQFIGSSLMPLLENKSFSPKKYVFASSKPPHIPSPNDPLIEERAVRNERYKLIWYKYKPEQYELYDLVSDPGETKNLVNELPQVFNELKDQLNNYVKQYGK